MTTLEKLYAEWYEITAEQIADGLIASTDCGEAAVREDFSSFADLDEVISFEDMLDLELSYDFDNRPF